jgi:hypothetical protein
MRADHHAERDDDIDRLIDNSPPELDPFTVRNKAIGELNATANPRSQAPFGQT